MIENVVKDLKSFMEEQKNISPDIILTFLHCLEACTTITESSDCKNSTKLYQTYDICGEIFNSHLCTEYNKFEDPIKSKVGISIC